MQRAESVLHDVVDGRSILIGPAGTHVVELNELGSAVWQDLDGSRELPDLVAAVRARLDNPDEQPPERIEADITAFLDELARLDLIRP